MPMYSAEKENTLLSLNESQGDKTEKSSWNVQTSASDSVDQQGLTESKIVRSLCIINSYY